MPINTEQELRRMEEAMDRKATEGGGSKDYNPDEVFLKIKTSDHHGHSEVLHGRVHPRLASMIGKVVERQNSPIRSRSEFVNLACYHFLKGLQVMFEDMPTMAGKISGLAALVDDEKLVDDYNATFAKAVEVIELRMSQGMTREAHKIAMRFIGDIDQMSDRSDWKKKWKVEAQERFEKILEGGGTGDE